MVDTSSWGVLGRDRRLGRNSRFLDAFRKPRPGYVAEAAVMADLRLIRPSAGPRVRLLLLFQDSIPRLLGVRNITLSLGGSEPSHAKYPVALL